MFDIWLIKHIFIVLYILIWIACATGFGILTDLLFSAKVNTSTTGEKTYVLNLNQTQIELAKTGSIIFFVIILPVLIYFFYLFKAKWW